MKIGEGPEYKIQEKITSIILVLAILLFIAKEIYYDGHGGEIIRIAFPAILGVLVLVLIIFTQLRQDLFLWWLSKMVFLPLVILIAMVFGIMYYFVFITGSDG